MTNERKVIRAKVGLLELARHLGKVSQACKIMGYSRDTVSGQELLRLLGRLEALHLPLSSSRWPVRVFGAIV